MTENNITFLATSGGHGSTITLATVQDGVALNLVNFNNVTVNETEETITVGGGAHFGDVWKAAYAASRELR
jgi:fumiquinazoline A oxidase